MTKNELSDNLSFLSALRLLEQLVKSQKLTEAEAGLARAELEKRLRPTMLFA